MDTMGITNDFTWCTSGLSDLITPKRFDTDALIDSVVRGEVATDTEAGTCTELNLNARMMSHNVRAEAKGSKEPTMSETMAIPSKA
jgi:hypothetical protein